MWEEFPPISTAEWEATIRADLKGADYAKKLVWQTEEGFAVKPYYRREDLPGTTGQARFNGKWEPRSLADIPKDAVRGDLLHEQGATSVQEVAMHWPNRPASAIPSCSPLAAITSWKLPRGAATVGANFQRARGDLVADFLSEQEPVRPL